MVTLRDGVSTKSGPLYWGLVNVKFLKGELCFDDGKLVLSLPSYHLKLYLSKLQDLYIVGEIFGDEVYRPVVNTTLKERIVVDIGSFIGLTPIYFALQGAKVLAFEVLPVHYHFSLLNLKINNLTNRAIVRNVAIGSTKTKVAVPSGYSDYTYSIYKKLPSGDVSYVDMITLDEVFDRYHLDKIHLLKMDCEGCEHEIFKSISADNLKKVYELILEFHGKSNFIVEKLKKNDFCIIKLRRTIRAYNKHWKHN
jgi:FkbM family methyltransferase